MNRRTLLKSLASLPLLGWLAPKVEAAEIPPVECVRTATAHYVLGSDGYVYCFQQGHCIGVSCMPAHRE